MRKLAVWLGITFLPACCAIQGAQSITEHGMTLAEQLEYKTVSLDQFVDEKGKMVDPSGPGPVNGKLVPNCTAVWVGPHVLLTAEHCVDDINKPHDEVEVDDEIKHLLEILEHNTVTKKDVKKVPWTPLGQPVMYSLRDDISPDKRGYRHGVVSAVDIDNDLALVTVDEEFTHPIAHLSKRVIHDGEEAHIVGHPAGMWWTYVHGYVSASRPRYSDGKGHAIDMLQISAPIFFGNSGGCAFDNEGNIIGLADAITGVPDAGMFVSRDTLRVFLTHHHVVQ